MKPLVPLLDNTRRPTAAKALRVLDWKPRSREDAIVATAESLVRFGIVGESALARGNAWQAPARRGEAVV